MASAEQLSALRQWLTENGGYLHPCAVLDHNENAGAHIRAAEALAADTRICTIPHSVALSSLNALVDDGFTAFRNRGIPPQAIGHFYLMHQFLHKDNSFWRPYLDTLPQPNDATLGTLFYFDDHDLAWLEDTDVLFTWKARLANHELYYHTGLELLRKAKIETAPYTWDLYKWAVSMFTSRSFSSRAIHPQDSKYWTAYKHGADGRRQTALLDMSKAAPDDLDFPVLFPVLDMMNHDLNSRVHWNFDPGRFTVSIGDAVSDGAEVFNSYGPKSNDELLLGYGFCIPNNTNDKVLMTLKAPPENLRQEICKIQPGYFQSDGQWSSEKTTFGLRRISLDNTSPAIDVFEQLPASLLELLAYMVRDERRLPFEFIDHPRQSLVDETSHSRHYLPHLTRMIVTSMAPKLNKTLESTPSIQPTNKRQRDAQVYRAAQIDILQSVLSALRQFLISLLVLEFPHPDPLPSRPFITTIEGLLELLGRHSLQHAGDFADGVVANAGTADLQQLRQAGWEEDVFVILLCYCELAFGFDLPEYAIDSIANVEEPLVVAEMEQARGLLDIVQTAAAAKPGSLWGDSRWDEEFVARVGGRMLVHESFVMSIPIGTQQMARPVIYIRGQGPSADGNPAPWRD